jgi:hypothetical protein
VAVIHCGERCENQKELNVDFIERILGISPDGGSGSLELLLFAVPVVSLCIVYLVRSARFARGRRMR